MQTYTYTHTFTFTFLPSPPLSFPLPLFIAIFPSPKIPKTRINEGLRGPIFSPVSPARISVSSHLSRKDFLRSDKERDNGVLRSSTSSFKEFFFRSLFVFETVEHIPNCLSFSYYYFYYHYYYIMNHQYY